MDDIKVLHFYLSDVLACMELKCIVKVLPIMELELVPASPHYVAGLMNLAGNSVPVIDLTLLLGMKRKTEYRLETPILLCQDSKNQLALIVDSVRDISQTSASDLQMQDEMNKPSSPFIGTIQYNNQLSLLLNSKKIFEFCLSPNQSELSMNQEMYQYE